MTGPSGIKPFLILAVIIIIPYFIFMFYSASWLFQNMNLVVPVIVSMFTIIILYHSTRISFNDPGILPRRVLVNTAMIGKRTILLVQKGVFKKYKICRGCAIVRPDRSHHCGDCDNCVERFDHHCPWLGNCIGKRNYHNFFYFLAYIVLMSLIILIFSVLELVIRLKELKKEYLTNLIDSNQSDLALPIGLSQLINCLYLIIYSSLGLVFSLPLLIYHFYLIKSNLTTKEEVQDYYTKGVKLNPYFKNNLFMHFWEFMYPSKSRYSLQDKIIKEESKIQADIKNRNMILLTKSNINEKNIKLNFDKKDININSSKNVPEHLKKKSSVEIYGREVIYKINDNEYDSNSTKNNNEISSKKNFNNEKLTNNKNIELEQYQSERKLLETENCKISKVLDRESSDKKVFLNMNNNIEDLDLNKHNSGNTANSNSNNNNVKYNTPNFASLVFNNNKNRSFKTIHEDDKESEGDQEVLEMSNGMCKESVRSSKNLSS